MLNEEKKWYEKAGKESDVVISTRVRLARNLADMPFPNRMTPDSRRAPRTRCDPQRQQRHRIGFRLRADG